MVIARAMKTPRCSRNLLEAKFRANAPNGVAIATSIYLCPSASQPPPHEPRRTSSARLMLKTPALPARLTVRQALSAGRAFKTAPAPRQALAQAGCRVIPMQDRDSTVSSMARLLRVFDRLFQQNQKSSARWAVRRHASACLINRFSGIIHQLPARK